MTVFAEAADTFVSAQRPRTDLIGVVGQALRLPATEAVALQIAAEDSGASGHATRPQQFLNFFPLPHGHGSLRPTFGNERRTGRSIDTSPAPSPSPSPAMTPAIAPTGWRIRASAPAVGATGACSRNRNCGSVARKFSNACRLEVLRKRLLSTSFLMFAINSTNMS